mgnify:FL=1
MNSFEETTADVEPKSLTNEELSITIIYYSIAFLIFVTSLIFINKRI